MKKIIKDYVGAGVTLGAGSMVLGEMGQGAIATKIATPAANMMGVGMNVGAGMSIMNMANNYSKTGKPYKMKKGKLTGRGWI
jgi:hypothetical protein